MNRHRMHYRGRPSAGFTLIELLVVVAILSILMYILSPVLAKAREKMRQTVCLSNQRQIAIDIITDVKDASERFPTETEVWGEAKYSKDLLECPSNKDEVANSYAFNGALAGVAMNSIVSPTSTILTGDAKSIADTTNNVISNPDDFDRRHNGKFIASFVDTHVKLIKDPPLPGEE